MGYGPYIIECSRIILDLETELTDEDIEMLRKDCVLLRREGWLKWCAEHRSDVDLFVSELPQKRAQNARWQDPLLKRKLVLAGLQQTYKAKALLTVMMAHHLEPKGAPRALVARAGNALDYFYLEEPIHWPFGGVDPFLENAFELLFNSRVSPGDQ